MAEYNHTQGSSSATWTITHNLNSDSILIDVMIDDGPNSPDVEKLTVSTEEVSDNQVQINFSEAHTGFARIVA